MNLYFSTVQIILLLTSCQITPMDSFSEEKSEPRDHRSVITDQLLPGNEQKSSMKKNDHKDWNSEDDIELKTSLVQCYELTNKLGKNGIELWIKGTGEPGCDPETPNSMAGSRYVNYEGRKQFGDSCMSFEQIRDLQFSTDEFKSAKINEQSCDLTRGYDCLPSKHSAEEYTCSCASDSYLHIGPENECQRKAGGVCGEAVVPSIQAVKAIRNLDQYIKKITVNCEKGVKCDSKTSKCLGSHGNSRTSHQHHTWTFVLLLLAKTLTNAYGI